jgi:hypothetical protein
VQLGPRFVEEDATRPLRTQERAPWMMARAIHFLV